MPVSLYFRNFEAALKTRIGSSHRRRTPLRSQSFFSSNTPATCRLSKGPSSLRSSTRFRAPVARVAKELENDGCRKDWMIWLETRYGALSGGH